MRTKEVQQGADAGQDAQAVDQDAESAEKFYEYYAQESASDATLERFGAIRDAMMRTLTRNGMPTEGLTVGDVGCGAGTQCLMWARDGHRVHGVDINDKLMALGQKRAADEGLDIDLQVGTATKLPWPDSFLDVCLVPELLEHVAEWEACLDEFARVLKPGGVVYLSTTNYLCPVQAEFNLPMYAWYPGFLKRRYEKLAFTTRPELANFAKYPAVNWFSMYSLGRSLRERGFGAVFDRFDIADTDSKSAPARLVFGAIRAVPPLRWLAHVGTPYTVAVSIKNA
ncbi:MAG: class I SAM-dependent methyltransferase [Pseudomonadota bacterium]